MQAYQDEGLISVLESNFELLLALLSFFFRIKLYAKTFFLLHLRMLPFESFKSILTNSKT